MSKALSRKVAALALAAMGGLGAVLVAASPAEAHNAVVSGKTKCIKDGVWEVRWTVSNDYHEIATLSKVVFNPAAGASIAPEVPARSGGRDGQVRSSAVRVPANVDVATLSFTATWLKDGFTVDRAGSVNRPSKCPKPSPSASASVSPSVSASATPSPPPETASPSVTPSRSGSVSPSVTPSTSASVTPSTSVSVTPSASVSVAPPALPVTGTPTGALLGGGAVLVLGGAGLVVALRRRRRLAFVAE